MGPFSACGGVLADTAWPTRTLGLTAMRPSLKASHVWGAELFDLSWLFSSRRKALTLLTHHYSFLRCLTFELTGRRR